MFESLPNQDVSGSRRVFDPERSDTIENIMCTLVDMYKSGRLAPELRPTTLIELGGDFKAFYLAAFRRESRPEWAEKRFPGNFSDLVDEINRRLAPHELVVSNTKLVVCTYGKLKADQLHTIKTLQALYRSCELSLKEALRVLRDDFNINLSSAQSDYFFRQRQTKATQAEALDNGISERKKTLVGRINALRNDLSINLGIRECFQGLVFESFVGAFLAYHFGAEKIERQKKLPVAYTDLYGRPHYNVYLDFLRPGAGTQSVIEVKLKNSFENILNSALAQLYAFEKTEERRGLVTVVYKAPCPLMKMAVDANLSVEDEISRMKLDELLLNPRRLNDLIRYVSIDDFIREFPESELFLGYLARISDFLEKADSEFLQSYEDGLNRIAASKDGISDKLDVILRMADNMLPMPQSLAGRLFGSIPRSASGENMSSDQRAKRILQDMEGRRDSLIKELYLELFQEIPKELTSEVISRIEGLEENVFNEGVLRLLSKKETEKVQRVRNRCKISEGRVVLAAHDRITARVRDEHLSQLTDLRGYIGDKIKEALSEAKKVEAFALNAAYAKPHSAERGQREFFTRFQMRLPLQRFLSDLSNLIIQRKQVDNQLFSQFREFFRLGLEETQRSIERYGGQMLSSDGKVRVSSASMDQMREHYKQRFKEFDNHKAVKTVFSAEKLIKKHKMKISPDLAGFMSRVTQQHKSPVFQIPFMIGGLCLDVCDAFVRVLPFDGTRLLVELSVALSDASDDQIVDFLSYFRGLVSEHLITSEYLIRNDQLLLNLCQGQAEFNLQDYLSTSLEPFRTVIIGADSDVETPKADFQDNLLTVLDTVVLGVNIANDKHITLERRGLHRLVTGMRFFMQPHICYLISREAKSLSNKRWQFNQEMKTDSIRMRENFDSLVSSRSGHLMKALDESRILSANIILDYYSRKLSQAAVIEFFAPDLVFDYLKLNNPPSALLRESFDHALRVILDLNQTNDRLFEDLVLS